MKERHIKRRLTYPAVTCSIAISIREELVMTCNQV